MAGKPQVSFGGGEISSSLYARVDLARYQTALRKCRNMIVLQQGGVANRPGTRFVAAVKDSSKTVRLIPFIFNEAQAYVCEFGDRYIRLHTAGGTVLDGSPAWLPNHVYALGETVKGDTPAVPTHVYRCIQAGTSAAAGGPTGHDAIIFDGPDTLAWKYVYPVGATQVLEIPAYWIEADLPRLNFVQAGDILTIVHPDYVPAELRRYSNTDWRLDYIALDRTLTNDTSIFSLTNYGTADVTHPAKYWSYVVTVQRLSSNPEESLPSVEYTTTSAIYLDRICRLGISLPSHLNVAGGAEQINVYRGMGVNRIYGYVGSVKIIAGLVGANYYFDDDVSVPSYIDAPPTGRTPFPGTANYPGVVVYHEQRLVLGGFKLEPQTIRMSRTANFRNFDFAEPSQDDDALSFPISSNQANEIRGLISARRLLTFTMGAAYAISSGSDGPMTPSTLNCLPQSFIGTSYLHPLSVNNVALYVQQKGNRIRELVYDNQQENYGGADLSILATHLFKKRQVVSWAFSSVPYSIVWTILDSGRLLGLTYLREHDVIGWHRHDSGVPNAAGRYIESKFEQVCVIPEDNEDTAYFAVNRGTLGRTIEKMASRQIEDPTVDPYFVDCGLTYNGWGPGDGTTTIELTDGTTWERGTRAKLHDNGGAFTAALVVGDHVFIAENGDFLPLKDRDPAATIYKFKVVELIDATHVWVECPCTVPLALYDATPHLWYYGVAHTRFTGLDHLLNVEVAIFTDGSAHPTQVVAGDGSITLAYPAVVVHAGLAYDAEIESLGLQLEGVNIRTKPKLVERVGIELEDTLGVWVGEAGGELIQAKQRQLEPLGSPTKPLTDSILVGITPTWNKAGRVTVKQFDPLPLTVLGLYPEADVGR
jgi:hypothetical protein